MLPKPFTLTIPMQDKYTVQIDTLLSSLALNAVAPMPANTILGNASNVVAAPTALTIANLQAMLGLASTYVPYTGATKAVNLGGQALTTGALIVGTGVANTSANLILNRGSASVSTRIVHQLRV